MAIGVWILGDQLRLGQVALKAHQANRSQVPVLFIESQHFEHKPQLFFRISLSLNLAFTSFRPD